jgi:integrase
VDLPKLNKLPVREIDQQQVDGFFNWLAARWCGWRLPALFFETKAVAGCRLADLCSVRSDDLSSDHRLKFRADNTKARTERVAVLPPDLWAEVTASAGRRTSGRRTAPTYPGT